MTAMGQILCIPPESLLVTLSEGVTMRWHPTHILGRVFGALTGPLDLAKKLGTPCVNFLILTAQSSERWSCRVVTLCGGRHDVLVDSIDLFLEQVDSGFMTLVLLLVGLLDLLVARIQLILACSLLGGELKVAWET